MQKEEKRIHVKTNNPNKEEAKGYNRMIFNNLIKGEYKYTNKKGEQKSFYRLIVPNDKKVFETITLPSTCLKQYGGTSRIFIPLDMNFDVSVYDKEEKTYKIIKTLKADELADIYNDVHAKINNYKNDKAKNNETENINNGNDNSFKMSVDEALEEIDNELSFSEIDELINALNGETFYDENENC